MPPWRLRDFHDDDLDQVISVWDQSRHPAEPPPVFAISEVVSAARSDQPAVVALVGDELVGIAVAHFRGERAWISIIGLNGRWRNRGIGSALLTELETRLHALGVRRIGALLAPEATGTTALRNSGYDEHNGLSFFEKVDQAGASEWGCGRSSADSPCHAACGRRWPAWSRRSRSSSAGWCCR